MWASDGEYQRQGQREYEADDERGRHQPEGGVGCAGNQDDSTERDRELKQGM